MHLCKSFEYGRLVFRNDGIGEDTIKICTSFFKSYIGHTNTVFCVSFLRLLLGYNFIVFRLKVQEIFRFCEVFEATKKGNFKLFYFCFCFILFCLITIAKAATVGRGTSTFAMSFLRRTGRNKPF